MEGMIFAAGLGTRLRPLTDRTPKALIPVNGRPLLAWVMDRMVAAGVTRLIVNTSAHAEQVRDWIGRHTPRGVEIVLSHEPDGPYETGGGLRAAAPLFRGQRTILLHNVDVLTDIPLERLLDAHRAARERSDAVLATVAVQSRESGRRLLFDSRGLVGWERLGQDGTVVESQRARDPAGELRRWDFAGIHAVEPALLALAEPRGRFSMIEWYLDLARRGYAIMPLDVSGHEWIDVGTPERLAQAAARLSSQRPGSSRLDPID
jgi:NDP-sugar pyrophosphorylase family protein